MTKYPAIALLCIVLLFPRLLSAQITPREGSKLNYRLIGFSFPRISNTGKYTIQIASGNFNDVQAFSKNIIASFSSASDSIIGEVPGFGKEYTWRVAETPALLHHFSTMSDPIVDTSLFRLRVTKQAEKYKDAYVFADSSKTLYDMQGRPVWFLPTTAEMPVFQSFYGDFKATDDGYITFARADMKHERMLEVDYSGHIRWESPPTNKLPQDSLQYDVPDKSHMSDGIYMGRCYWFNRCHHEFTKLPNGHFMALANEFMWLKLPRKPSSTKGLEGQNMIIRQGPDNVYYQRAEFGALTEYDTNARVIWSWSSAKYFINSDVYRNINWLGYYDIDDIHANSFAFDEKKHAIYVSFKTISRIIKLQYPAGKVTAVYGKLNEENDPGYDNNFYYHQHNCRITKNGLLSVYNNNDRNPQSLPTLLLLKLPASDNGSLKKVWEYQCKTDPANLKVKNPDFGSRGSVEMLPDGSVMACMASRDYSDLFIVSRDKKILWNAFAEKWDNGRHEWLPVMEYVASIIIDRKKLEKLIWNTGVN